MHNLSNISVEDIRAAVARALGDSSVTDIAADASLVRTGTISSLDIVAVTLELERSFGVEIPDAEVTVKNFDTLAAMAELITGIAAHKRTHIVLPPMRMNVPMRSLAGALRRPVLMVLLTCAFLIGLDFALGAFMRGPLADADRQFREDGNRLYPVSGGYSADDLGFSVAQHRITRARDSARPRIAFFGDSGTIGSWVRYQEAIPAQALLTIKQIYPHADSYNLAFFMQLFAKDLMILEAAIEYSGDKLPFDVAVFTVGDDYFSKSFSASLLVPMPYLSLNRGLLKNFYKRLPADRQNDFYSVCRQLNKAARKNSNFVGEWLELHSALYHYAPFFRYYIEKLPLVKSDYNFYYQFKIGQTPLYSPIPVKPPAGFALSLGIADADADLRVPAMMGATIDYLRAHDVKVVLFLKPKGPNEWQSFYHRDGKTAADYAADLCRASRCTVVDERWAISGTQFTDSIAHYNVAANRDIGASVGEAVLKELGR